MSSITQGIIVAIIASIVATVISFIGTKYSLSAAGFHNVSNERIKWIRRIQELYSICASYYCLFCSKGCLSESDERRFHRACEELKIRMSGGNKYPGDGMVLEKLDLLQSDVTRSCSKQTDVDADNGSGSLGSDTNRNTLIELHEILQIIVKGEWDKVKVESGDSIYKQHQVENIQNEVNCEFFERKMNNEKNTSETGGEENKKKRVHGDSTKNILGKSYRHGSIYNLFLSQSDFTQVGIIMAVTFLSTGITYLCLGNDMLNVTLTQSVVVGVLVSFFMAHILVYSLLNIIIPIVRLNLPKMALFGFWLLMIDLFVVMVNMFVYLSLVQGITNWAGGLFCKWLSSFFAGDLAVYVGSFVAQFMIDYIRKE